MLMVVIAEMHKRRQTFVVPEYDMKFVKSRGALFRE